MNLLSEKERALIKALDEPLPLTPQPFAEVAQRAGVSQEQALATLRAWRAAGVIRRFGARVRHHELGYTANGMSVWKIPADKVDAAAAVAAEMPQVSHCYERHTAPGWEYNFYAMIHGRNEQEVRDAAARIARETGIADYEVLFSTKEFKKSVPKYGEMI